MKIFFAIIGALVVLAIIVFGGWQLGWWFQTQNVDRQNNVNIHSQQYQDGLVQQERDRLQGWDIATDPGQKKQIALTFCQVYPDITYPPADLAQRQAQVCTN